MRRRDLLAFLGAAGVSTSVLAAPARQRIERIGLQLYTLKNSMQIDVDATLARVAAIGYREVEFAGYFGRSPQQVRDSLRKVGLEAPAAHVSLKAIGEGWEAMLQSARDIGHRYLVVASAGGLTSLDDYRRTADSLNRAGETAAKAGIRLGYHNHDFEFKPIDGKLPYDVLCETTDPKHVCLEMDLYWIVKGGQDPLRYFARWPGRIELVHVKDASAAPGLEMRDVGGGSIDWRAIFARRREAGIKHYFVEYDDPTDPFGSIAASFSYLNELRF